MLFNALLIQCLKAQMATSGSQVQKGRTREHKQKRKEQSKKQMWQNTTIPNSCTETPTKTAVLKSHLIFIKIIKKTFSTTFASVLHQRWPKSIVIFRNFSYLWVIPQILSDSRRTFQPLFSFTVPPSIIQSFKRLTSTPSLAHVPNAQTGAGHRDDVRALVLVPLPLGPGLWSKASMSAKSEPTLNQQH